MVGHFKQLRNKSQSRTCGCHLNCRKFNFSFLIGSHISANQVLQDHQKPMHHLWEEMSTFCHNSCDQESHLVHTRNALTQWSRLILVQHDCPLLSQVILHLKMCKRSSKWHGVQTWFHGLVPRYVFHLDMGGEGWVPLSPKKGRGSTPYCILSKKMAGFY